MTQVHPYLNFDGNAQEAFDFYRSVFGGDFAAVHRIGNAPGTEGLPEEEKNRLMHIALPIGGGTMLMASDIVPSMGHTLTPGNNAHISLHPDTREEADRLFNGLSAGGRIDMPIQDTFWGAYFGSFADKYGIQWMINHTTMPQQ